MKNILGIILAILAGALLIFISLQTLSVTPQEIDPNLSVATLVATQQIATKATAQGIDDIPFRDNKEIYQNDQPDSIVTMYVTVRKGNASDDTLGTWKEINDSTQWLLGQRAIVDLPAADAILQIGDETGPLPGEVGYGEVVANATIRIRGASSSARTQKSYKIELRDRAGLWRGQRTIALNKHVGDPIRTRNKLNFDLMKDVDNLVSLRTQFVHLYIKDETSDPPSDKFVDYGMFTQIEQPNNRFLRNHLLDQDGQLYKANFFEFYRYPEAIRMADDPLYDEVEFSKHLEIKGSKDHGKLIQMLDDVNNYNIPIEQTFEKYFDEENYFTWLAYNILVGNVDTQSQNYYLYSPKNGEKWYFIGWDFDGSLFRQSQEPLGYTPYEFWELGVSNYWGGVLHNRLLKVEAYRARLDEKIEQLRLFLTPERISSMLNTYRPVVEPFAFAMPDSYYLPADRKTYNDQYTLIPKEIELNYQLYKESLIKPMPYYLGTPKIVDDNLMFNWEEAYNFELQKNEYHFMLARDWAFTDIIYDYTLTDLLSISVPMLEPGTYFWRVMTTNEDGATQSAFDYYMDTERHQHAGMKYLYISKDGQILEK